MEQKHLLWRKDATLTAKLVVIISLTGSGYQRPRSSCLCKVGRRKGRNTEDVHCREEWEQDRRKRRLRDWMSRENNGQRRRWKNGGSAAMSQPACLSAPTCSPSPQRWATQARLLPRVTNIYITTLNSEATCDLFLHPSMNPCGFHSFLLNRSRKVSPAKLKCAICQIGLNKTRRSHPWWQLALRFTFCSSSKRPQPVLRRHR